MRSFIPPFSFGTASLLAAAIVQVVYLLQQAPFLNEYVLTVDDTYYYLEISRNIARLGWSTFDGLHQTSGVQLLWTVLLVALAKLVTDPLLFMRAMLVVCVILNVTAGVLLRRLASAVHSSPVGEIAAVLWSLVLISSGSTLTGMEFSLHLSIITGTLLALYRVLDSGLATRGAVVLSVMATLNFWTRLDSALFSVLVLLLPSARLLSGRPARWQSRIVTMWAIPAAGALLYIVTCYWLAGTPLPISGLVKAYYASAHFADYSWWLAASGRLLWWLRIQAQPATLLVSSVIGLDAATAPLALRGSLALAALWTVLLMFRRSAQPDHHDRQLAGLSLSIWLASAVHAWLVVASVGHFSHVTSHYYGWSLVAWCLMTALLLNGAVREMSAPRRRGVVGATIALVVLVQVVTVSMRLASPIDMTSLRNVRTDLIGWIAANLPEGAPIASWNAGQFGYFLTRPVVNLDGLVNDTDFLNSLRRGEPVVNYLRREGVRYVVDYNDPDLSMPYLADWDRTMLFRGQIPWADVDQLQKRAAGGRTLYVLRLKDVAETNR